MKQLIIFSLVLLLIPFVAAQIIITEPVSPISQVDAELQLGGSLTANTTYFITVQGANHVSSGEAYWLSRVYPVFNVTTNDTFKTIYLNWTTASGAGAYTVYVTTDKTNWKLKNIKNPSSSIYHTTTNNYYNLSSTAYGSWAVGIYGIPDTLYGINKSTPLVKVEFNGTGDYTLEDVTAALDAYGLNDSYFQAETNFYVLRIGLYCTNEFTGSFKANNQMVVWLHGRVIFSSCPDATIQVGSRNNAGRTYNGVWWDFATQRTGWSMSNSQNFSDVKITKNKLFNSVTSNYFSRNSQMYIFGGTDGFKDVNTEFGFRGAGGMPRDVTISGSGFYTPSVGLLRIKQYNLNSGDMTHTGGSDGVYDSDFYICCVNKKHIRTIGSATRYFYDVRYYDENGVKLKYPNMNTAAAGTSTHYFMSKFKIVITDENNNPLNGVNISFSGNGTLVLQDVDTSVDGELKGATISGNSVLTNASGYADAYISMFRWKDVDLAFTDYYPINVTVTHTGHQIVNIVLDEVKIYDWKVVLLTEEATGNEFKSVIIRDDAKQELIIS